MILPCGRSVLSGLYLITEIETFRTSLVIFVFRKGSRVMFGFLWCFFLIQAMIINGVSGLHHSWKYNPEVQALLMKHQSHHGMVLSTPPSNAYRRTGKLMSPSQLPSTAPRTSDAEVHYLNSLQQSAKNSENLYNRRELSNANPWATLYSPGSVYMTVRHFPPTSSNLLLRTDRPIFQNANGDRVLLVNTAQMNNDLSSGQNVSPSYQNKTKNFLTKNYSTEDELIDKKNVHKTNSSAEKTSQEIEQELEDVRLANEHFLRMRNTMRCRVPVPEVVCVKDFHAVIEKEYLPRCTLLHRCSDRTGCCDTEDFECVPSVIQEVALNFYTVHTDYRPGELPPENTVEKLLFENHTECECVAIKNHSQHLSLKKPGNQHNVIADPVQEQKPENSTVYRQDQSDDYSPQSEQQEVDKRKLQQRKKCGECPVPFHHREYEDGRCSCDCFDKERPCIRIKRGREPLSEHERRCVESGRCHIPDCEYGQFTSSTGRCPRKPDDYEKAGKNGKPKKLPNHHHRWMFFERD